MIGSLRVGGMSIILEETKLDDARKHFGAGIGGRGDAGDAEAWVCLHGSDDDGPWMFWLTSGEIDGPSIGGFQWRRLSPDEMPDRRCPLLSKKSGGIELPAAIHLGIEEQEVRQILGRPTFEKGKLLIFSHEHRRVIRGETFYVSNNIAILVREGVVWAIEVAKSTGD